MVELITKRWNCY